jgi:murein L,D-transpeptidase YafK
MASAHPDANIRRMVLQNLGKVSWLFAAAALLACACRPTSPPPVSNAPPELHAPPPCERIAAIAVIKRERRLLAYCDGGGLVEMVAALGRGAAGPKRGLGDARTPEGEYRVAGSPRLSRFHQFIPIDYPSLADAEAAHSEGRLSDGDYRRIAAAHADGQEPPPDTSLGGSLGIHGEGMKWRGKSRQLDWTLGCIGVTDADVDFLAERIAIGTPVSILP